VCECVWDHLPHALGAASGELQVSATRTGSYKDLTESLGWVQYAPPTRPKPVEGAYTGQPA
jgi:hypothetical protein